LLGCDASDHVTTLADHAIALWGRALNVHMKRRNTAKCPIKPSIYRIFQLISHGMFNASLLGYTVFSIS
jgi:hypothetical protein